MDIAASKETPRLDSLGGRIRAVRLARGLNVNTAARAVGISRTSFTHWESNITREPRVENLLAFTKLTDVDLDWLLERRGDDPDLGRDNYRQPMRASGDEPAAHADAVAIPEVAPSLACHARQIDPTPRANWVIPSDVLEIGFHAVPEACVIKRIVNRTGISDAANMARGDYILIDTSRTRIDEPGVYLVRDPKGHAARRALVTIESGKGLQITVLADDITQQDVCLASGDLIVLGRIMGIFHPI